jgi:hypothetical protein
MFSIHVFLEKKLLGKSRFFLPQAKSLALMALSTWQESKHQLAGCQGILPI